VIKEELNNMPKIKVKRGSSRAWVSETLEYGELGYNKTTKELMVGDEGEPTRYIDGGTVAATRANALRGTKNGEFVEIADADIASPALVKVSGVEDVSAVKVTISSRNLYTLDGRT
jgi:hypothetical protein